MLWDPLSPELYSPHSPRVGVHELAKARSSIQEWPGMPKEFLEDERYDMKYIIKMQILYSYSVSKRC